MKLSVFLLILVSFSALAHERGGPRPQAKESLRLGEKPGDFVPFEDLRVNLKCDRNPLNFPKGLMKGVCYQKWETMVNDKRTVMTKEQFDQRPWKSFELEIKAQPQRTKPEVSTDGTISTKKVGPAIAFADPKIPIMELSVQEDPACYTYKGENQSDHNRYRNGQHFDVSTFDVKVKVGKNERGRNVLIMEYESDHNYYHRSALEDEDRDQTVGPPITAEKKFLDKQTHASAVCVFNLADEIQ